MMEKPHLTLMIVPDAHAPVRRVRVRREIIFGSAILGLVGLALLSTIFVHYVYVIGEVFEAQNLRRENGRLEARVAELSDSVQVVDGRLAELQRLEEKLRDMTHLNDSDRGLALGPLSPPTDSAQNLALEYDPFAVPIAEAEDAAARSFRDALLASRVAGLSNGAQRQVSSLSQLIDDLTAQDAVLASTPSIWPAKGWITSGFGGRNDPYTGARVMHLGVDLAAREGVPVQSPARGVVIYAGDRGAYGLVVAVDHDRGIVTHYAHLSRMMVKVGDVVERGQHIANVGNTGRSTGPHLHYEVRVNGVPVNPRRYVLE